MLEQQYADGAVMTLDDLPFPIRECLALLEAFLRLGFKGDDVYFQPSLGRGKPHAVGICLHTQGHTFAIKTGDVLGDPVAAWVEACDIWSASSDDDRDRLYQSSRVLVNAPELVRRLRRAGFELPCDRRESVIVN